MDETDAPDAAVPAPPDEVTEEDAALRDAPDPDPLDDPDDVLLETQEFAGVDNGEVDPAGFDDVPDGQGAL